MYLEIWHAFVGGLVIRILVCCRPRPISENIRMVRGAQLRGGRVVHREGTMRIAVCWETLLLIFKTLHDLSLL